MQAQNDLRKAANSQQEVQEDRYASQCRAREMADAVSSNKVRTCAQVATKLASRMPCRVSMHAGADFERYVSTENGRTSYTRACTEPVFARAKVCARIQRQSLTWLPFRLPVAQLWLKYLPQLGPAQDGVFSPAEIESDLHTAFATDQSRRVEISSGWARANRNGRATMPRVSGRGDQAS